MLAPILMSVFPQPVAVAARALRVVSLPTLDRNSQKTLKVSSCCTKDVCRDASIEVAGACSSSVSGSSGLGFGEEFSIPERSCWALVS